MLQRKIGVLAGSILAAAGANAAIDISSGNVLIVLNTVGNGSYYIDAGSTNISCGGSLSVDVSAASAVLGGTIDSFAVLQFNSGNSDYNYTEFLYVDHNGGLVYSGNSGASSETNRAAVDEVEYTQSFLSNVNIGFNGEGSLGDFDSNVNTAQYLSTLPSPISTRLQAAWPFQPNTTYVHTVATATLSSNTLTIDQNIFDLGMCPKAGSSGIAITEPLDGSDVGSTNSVTATVELNLNGSCTLFLNDSLIADNASRPFVDVELLSLIPGSNTLNVVCTGGYTGITSEQSTFFANLNPSVISGDTSGTVNQNEVVTGTLTATDADGLTDGTYFTVTTPPIYGQAIINPASGFWIYLADVLFAGEDPFTVTVTDDLGFTTEQAVSIIVIGVDTDGDTLYDFQDNCPNDANIDQADLDGDGIGDVCDDDRDGDGTNNTFDAFPDDPAEDTDSDGDLVGDNSDNCVNDINVNQENLDGDTLGDACDDDIDGDGFLNVVEAQFGGNEFDDSDVGAVLSNIELFSANADTDADFDGVPDAFEDALGTNPNDPADAQSALDILLNNIAKSVPMPGIAAAILGLGLFAVTVITGRKRKVKQDRSNLLVSTTK